MRGGPFYARITFFGFSLPILPHLAVQCGCIFCFCLMSCDFSQSSCFTFFSSISLFSFQGTPASPVVGSNGLEPSTSRLSGVRSNHLSYEPISVAVRCHFSANPCLASRFFNAAGGGDEQNRTVDPLLARQVLSQLSYTPKLKVRRFLFLHRFSRFPS